MRNGLALLLACLVVAGVSEGRAATLNFGFSFTNAQDNGGGLISGLILGVEDDATGRAASVRITSNENGFGLGEYVSAGDPAPNIFTAAGGQLTTFNFQSVGIFNQPPAVTCCTFNLIRSLIGGGVRAGLADFPSGVNVPIVDDFSLHPLIGEPPPIPLPAPILMIGFGIGRARLGGPPQARPRPD